MRSTCVLGFLSVAAALLPLAACSSPATADSAPDAPISIRLYDDVGSLDPALPAGPPGYQVSMFLYDRLVAVVDGEVEPALATSWTVSPTSVEFAIRDDATCDDGSTLTPSAIAASMARALDPATKSTIAPSQLPGNVTFTPDDAAATLTVTSEQPNPALLVTFAHTVFSVVCPEGLKDPSALASKSFGTGPYVLEEAVPGTSYTLAKRDGYAWGPEPYADNADALPKAVTAKVLQNETTAANVFLQGGLDLTNSGNESAVQRMRTKNANEQRSADSFAFLLFNHLDGPGVDIAVRTAITQAIDPTAYAAAAQGELATPSANLLPDITPCAQTDGDQYRPEFDLDQARTTLEDDGWTRGSDGIYSKNGTPLTLRVGSHNQEGSAGDYLAQTLQDLGADVQSRQVEFPSYVEDLQKNDWDVYAATVNQLASPATLAPTIFGPGGLDAGHIRNDAFLTAMADAGSAASFDDACELWKAAQDELVASVDVAPQAHLNLVYFGAGLDFSFGYFGLLEPTSIVRQ